MLPLINLMHLAFLSEAKNKQKTKQQYFLWLESWVNSFLVFPLHFKKNSYITVRSVCPVPMPSSTVPTKVLLGGMSLLLLKVGEVVDRSGVSQWNHLAPVLPRAHTCCEGT